MGNATADRRISKSLCIEHRTYGCPAGVLSALDAAGCNPMRQACGRIEQLIFPIAPDRKKKTEIRLLSAADLRFPRNLVDACMRAEELVKDSRRKLALCHHHLGLQAACAPERLAGKNVVFLSGPGFDWHLSVNGHATLDFIERSFFNDGFPGGACELAVEIVSS